MKGANSTEFHPILGRQGVNYNLHILFEWGYENGGIKALWLFREPGLVVSSGDKIEFNASFSFMTGNFFVTVSQLSEPQVENGDF